MKIFCCHVRKKSFINIFAITKRWTVGINFTEIFWHQIFANTIASIKMFHFCN